MRPTRHSFTTTIDHLTIAGVEHHDVMVNVEYRFTPGRDATPASYSSGGEPPEPAEVELLSVVALDEGIAGIDVLKLLTRDDERCVTDMAHEDAREPAEPAVWD